MRDEGAGIPEQERARIFELFEQGERGNGNGGLGLGLYITRRIAEAHGGRVWVERAEGGSVFQLELPVEQQNIVERRSSTPHGSRRTAPQSAPRSHAPDAAAPRDSGRRAPARAGLRGGQSWRAQRASASARARRSEDQASGRKGSVASANQ